MKTLIRYTIGNVSESGFSCLRLSISHMQRLYPECDVVVCYNQLDHLEIPDVDTINQSDFRKSLPIPPVNDVCWKLYPPRLRIDSHELFIDNDIILEKRLPEVDHFLRESSSTLVYQGRHRNFGHFDPCISISLQLNSGIFGLPPHYNFGQKLTAMMKDTGFTEWRNKFDEQGLIASLLPNESQYWMISLVEIPIIEPHWHIYPYLSNKTMSGFHFVGLNSTDLHCGWEEYKAGVFI